MKYFIGFVLIILFLACSTEIDQRILGVWQVKDTYYTAEYQIEYRNKKLVGRILYYNDNTTILKATETDEDIFLNNLKYKKGIFVDAVSGATKTNTAQLKILNEDSLEATFYLNNNETTSAIWTKKN